jgi:hypothetical protein|tara:strand:- start:622 stop:879 length:258 start_codon:yes stop_codon:yes gene_type:complete
MNFDFILLDISIMISEFNDQYLNTTYDKFSQEQSQVMTALKNEEEEAKLFEKLYQQQVHILHRILMDLIKLRNLKSKIEEKKNNM